MSLLDELLIFVKNYSMAWSWTTIGINLKRAQHHASTILDLLKPIQSLSTSIEEEYLKRWFQIRSYLEFDPERLNGKEWFMIWERLHFHFMEASGQQDGKAAYDDSSQFQHTHPLGIYYVSSLWNKEAINMEFEWLEYHFMGLFEDGSLLINRQQALDHHEMQYLYYYKLQLARKLTPKAKMRRPDDKIWKRWSNHADREIKQELRKEATQGEAYQTEPYYNRFRDQQDTWMLDMQEELKATDADLFAFRYSS